MGGMDHQPAFSQINLAVRDMDATLAFYRGLGSPIEAEPGVDHMAHTLPGGPLVEWDRAEDIRYWDSGLTENHDPGLCRTRPRGDAAESLVA